MSIKPTLGRVIWYSPMGSLPASSNGYLAALICDVNPDETINLAVFDTKGNLHGRQNIVILDDDVESPVASQTSHYACWMPYQVGQAQKTEQLQAALDTKDDTAEATKMVDEGAPVSTVNSDGDVFDGAVAEGSGTIDEGSPLGEDAQNSRSPTETVE